MKTSPSGAHVHYLNAFLNAFGAPREHAKELWTRPLPKPAKRKSAPGERSRAGERQR